ncbi:hypothetical protein [Candidatus Ponderosibacter sp. Uisw_141_02]|jgi:hypothetical protein|uniref:hypothetical protein n=1 Tax=Candidatus Ponderosibacter sp. Uisw_141_02 TaxID=3231000 RepID=UPI003D5909E7
MKEIIQSNLKPSTATVLLRELLVFVCFAIGVEFENIVLERNAQQTLQVQWRVWI